jgi:hypothetical protein
MDCTNVLEIHCEEATIGRLSNLVGQGLPCPAQCLDRDSTSSNPFPSFLIPTRENMPCIGRTLNSGDLVECQLLLFMTT